MALIAYDPVRHPAHYTMYPMESFSICRHLGFCLGNVTKYILSAPWKNGVEDSDKALQYLRLEQETPQEEMDRLIFEDVDATCDLLGTGCNGNPETSFRATLRPGRASTWKCSRDICSAGGRLTAPPICAAWKKPSETCGVSSRCATPPARSTMA